jgi:hypothetical protein
LIQKNLTDYSKLSSENNTQLQKGVGICAFKKEERASGTLLLCSGFS